MVEKKKKVRKQTKTKPRQRQKQKQVQKVQVHVSGGGSGGVAYIPTPFYPTHQEPSVREIVREVSSIQPAQPVQNREADVVARTFTAPRIPREEHDLSEIESSVTTAAATTTPAKRRGRPPGSKNKHHFPNVNFSSYSPPSKAKSPGSE